MANPVRFIYFWVVDQLSNFGIVHNERGRRIADLAWPRFLTMFAKSLHHVADIAMVGVSVGPAAIAGLAFAFIYWGLANSFSLGLAGGTISQVSQRFGAKNYDQLDLAVKQSVIIGITIGIPFVLVYWYFSRALIGLIGQDPMTIELGAAYLQILSVGFLFNVINLISSRTLAGADDTWIAMTIRATGALLNIVLNLIFIFALGMGVQGAALGTVIAEGTIMCWFLLGFIKGDVPIIGVFPITISLGPPYLDLALSKQLLSISLPLIVQKIARSFARFPLFALLAIFGPIVVAGFEVARRLRSLMRSTGNGFSMSASSLVGQELGRDDEIKADQYAHDAVRFSLFIYMITGLLVFSLANRLAHLFTSSPDVISTTVPFIRVAAVSFVALGMDYTFMGILKGAGDNQWSMYGRFVGQYFALIPIIYLGTITPLGVKAVFFAMVAETASAATITGYRFISGEWKVVSRSHRPKTMNN